MTIELDPNQPFEAALIKMVQTNRAKRADYASDENPLSNFYETADHVSLTAGHSVELLIATKQSRLKNLLKKHFTGTGKPQNEGIEDSLLDRAVYAVIAMTIWEDGGYGSTEVDTSAEAKLTFTSITGT